MEKLEKHKILLKFFPKNKESGIFFLMFFAYKVHHLTESRVCILRRQAFSFGKYMAGMKATSCQVTLLAFRFFHGNDALCLQKHFPIFV